MDRTGTSNGPWSTERFTCSSAGPSPREDIDRCERPRPGVRTARAPFPGYAPRDSIETLRAKMPKVFADFQIAADVVYKTVGGRDLQLDLLTPKNLPKKPAPLLFHIHGGGWTGGDKKQDTAHYQPFLDKGISCAAINYRLTPDSPLPAPVHDAGRALPRDGAAVDRGAVCCPDRLRGRDPELRVLELPPPLVADRLDLDGVLFLRVVALEDRAHGRQRHEDEHDRRRDRPHDLDRAVAAPGGSARPLRAQRRPLRRAVRASQ